MELLAWVAVTLTCIRQLPQLHRLVVTRDGRSGVSFEAAAMNAALYLPWAWYGFATDSAQLIAANSAGLTASLLVAGAAARFGADTSVVKRPLALAAVLATTSAFSPAIAVSTTIIGPAAYGLPQIRDALRASSVRSLSPAAISLAAAETLLWLGTGVVTYDGPLSGYNAVASSVHLATLGIWAVRSSRDRRVPLIVAVSHEPAAPVDAATEAP